MAKDLYGRNYADMGEKYRSKYTKEEFKDARRKQRMAGEVIQPGKWESGQQYYNSDRDLVDTGAPNRDYVGQDNNPYTVKKIENFDTAAGGAGASKGTDRLSAQDIKRLHSQGGFSKKELIKYAENHDFGDGPGASGGKAQKLLAKYKDEIKAKKGGKQEDPVEPTPEPTPEPAPAPTPAPTPEPKPEPKGAADDQPTPGGQTEDAQNYSNQQVNRFRQILNGGQPAASAATETTESPSSTPQSDRDMAIAAEFPTGVPSDTNLGGKDFVDYFKNAGESKGTQDFLTDFRSSAQDRIDDLDVINTADLNTDINRSIQDSYDRASLSKLFTFGDIFNPNNKPPKWENSAPDPIEQPDLEKLSDKYRTKDDDD